MNYYVTIAAFLAVAATLGHFMIGCKQFMQPVLDSEVDIIPKKVMHSLFHYMSMYMIITSIALLSFAFCPYIKLRFSMDIVFFIGISYAGFAIAQFFIALTSGIPGGVFKLFQWVFWLLIAFFSLWATC
ncbi:MAG: hypothetical protein Q7J34_02320 [Bacteroidales bacterium]|jgi:hypothetical protein|nr:hypothetical protein [Bacteroidales bacterium]